MSIDFPDFVPGAALAHSATPQVNTGVLTLGGGQATGGQVIAMGGIGIDAFFNLEYPTNQGTIPFAQIDFEWSDAAANQILWVDSFELAGGNNTFLAHFMQLMVKGDQVAVNITNLDPAITMSYNWVLTSHSRPIPHDRGYQQQPGAVNGFNQPGGFPAIGEHANTSPTIAASGSVTRLLPFSYGKHTVSLANVSGANACAVSLADAISGHIWAKYVVAAGAGDTRELRFPGSHAQLTLTNQAGGVSITPQFTSIRDES